MESLLQAVASKQGLGFEMHSKGLWLGGVASVQVCWLLHRVLGHSRFPDSTSIIYFYLFIFSTVEDLINHYSAFTATQTNV